MLTHDFILLSEKQDPYVEYARFFHNPESILVPDGIINYISDTLQWIPSTNPANPTDWCDRGLNYYGPTIINKKGAAKAARVFSAWAMLWQQGPANINLTGAYSWSGNAPKKRNYEKFILQRQTLVKSFNTISNMATKAASGRFYVLHLGI